MPTPEEMLQYYQNVFGSAEGRIVLGDICELCHVFDNLDPKDADLCSQRNIGLTIMRQAGVLNPLYTQLGIKEKQHGGSDSTLL